MSLKTTLLAGVATVALAIAPALASTHAPAFHISSKFGRATPGASSHVFLHMKSNIHDPKVKNFTSTVTLTGSISTKADYKKKLPLFGYLWRAGCTEAPNEKWTLPKKTKVAKLGQSTQTGAISGCSGVYTFYDVDYTLESKTAKSDTFTGDLIAKNFMGYNLKLVANVDLTITK